MSDLCEYCLTDAGRFSASRHCCRVRLIAKSPAHVRKQHYEREAVVGGPLAEAALKSEVAEEYKRITELWKARREGRG